VPNCAASISNTLARDNGKKLGGNNHPTDPGIFRIFIEDKMPISHESNLPMHCAIFFTHDGLAIWRALPMRRCRLQPGG
jgi:hypothetical protein